MDKTPRKKKEKLGFMVAEFLSAYDAFNDIYSDFKEIISSGNSFASHNFYGRIRTLEEGLFYQVKDLAHSLFREDSDGKIKRQYDEMYKELEKRLSSGEQEKVHSIISDITIEGIKERLDQTIGQSFHELMILRENLYLLKEYEPRSKAEQGHSTKIEDIANRESYQFSEEEEKELSFLIDLDAQNQGEMKEAKIDVTKEMHNLKNNFEGITELLKHYIPRIKDKTTLDILSKNLDIIKERNLFFVFNSIGFIIGGKKRIGAYGKEKAEEFYSLINSD
ncbi:MAG: hypothetical protein QF506_00560 [Candidatus Woesearchaeota archaeon]|jgi:hypothetical protein|nr:hypothetical protein [Candidatus Woesearchaeota archaeon]